MPTTGIITGHEIGKNKTGTKDVVLLQVRITDKDDIQTVELMSNSGYNAIPPVGARVLIVQVTPSWKIGITESDNIPPSVDEGEVEIYSQENDTIKAFILLLKSGIIELNGNNDFAVRFTALETGLQAFITDLNTKLAAAFTGVGGSWPGTSLDISGAKVDEVKLP
ncbi:hypothetical protein AMJ80_02360 [bacterium SM23_31]|nr:MAG: hypothetical protein AMJ80_02360 [bacterium SM23_31]